MNPTENKETITIKVAPSTFLWIVAIAGTIFLLFEIQSILITLFFALIVMSALRPSVSWMEKKLRFPRIAAILVLYALIIFLIVLSFAVIIPPLISEFPNFIQTLSLPPLPNDLADMKLSISQISSLLPQIGTSFNAIFDIISSTFTGIFTAITTLVIASYLLIDRENLYLKAVWFTKEKKHLESVRTLIDQIEMQLGGWVRGQLSLMLVIGLVTFIGLTVMGVPYALPLALTAGLLEVLPNLGPTISAIPAIAIAFLVGGPAMALLVTIFYILVQQLENNFIVPKIMKDNADVNPLATIVLILVGLKLAGVIGALLAVPIYIVIRSVYAMWYREYYSVRQS